MDRIKYGVLFIICWINTTNAIQTETCQNETLHYECRNSNEVMVSESAIYGRNGTGCAHVNKGWQRCTVNALSIVDRLCTGKTKCNQVVVEDIFHNSECRVPNKIPNNLQYSFTCLTVLPSLPASEQLPPVNMIMNQPLTSTHDNALTCATETNPLTIKANKGQVIKIKVINFAHSISNESANCDVSGAFGYVNDVYNVTKPRVLICKGGVRESVVLTSAGETIQLVVTESMKSANFIVTFQVIDADVPSCNASTKTPVDSHIGCVLKLDDGSSPCQKQPFDLIINSAKQDWVWYLWIGLPVAVGIVIVIVAAICVCRCLQKRQRSSKGKQTENNHRRDIQSESNIYDDIIVDDMQRDENHIKNKGTEACDFAEMTPIRSSYLILETFVSPGGNHEDDEGYLVPQKLASNDNNFPSI